jgi:muramoyltetrapeptide carboxypeptidase
MWFFGKKKEEKKQEEYKPDDIYIKPFPLKDKLISIVAPCAYDGEEFDTKIKQGFANLKELGFNVNEEPSIYYEYPYNEEGFKTRAYLLNAAFASQKIGGVICRSGGSGTKEILPYVDFETIRKNPKVFCGYSDNTHLLMYMNDRLKMVVFHGPSLVPGISDLSGLTKRFFKRIFWENRFPFEISVLSFDSWKPGRVEGKVIGGNLSRLIEYLDQYPETDFTNKILFLEESYETIGKMCILFYKLKEKGVFDKIKGVLIGRFIGLDPKDLETVKMYLLQYLEKRDIPVLYGLMSGHGNERIPLPFGTDVMVDATTKRVIYQENPFREEEPDLVKEL